MLRTRRNIVGFFLLSIIVGVVVILSAASGSSATANSQPTTQVSIPSKTTPHLGHPAITPHLNGIPSFTLSDVRQYFKRYYQGFEHPPTIATIEFITARQASILRYGEYIGLPDNAIVCYVELHGTFGVPGPVPSAAKFPVSHTLYNIFDGQTGNLFIWGVLF